MKLLAISRFEISYQLSRPTTWLFFIALIFFSYLNTGDESVADALYEDFFLNSPFAIAKTTVVGTFIWLVMAATIAGTAAARDIATGIHPLTYTTPITKTDYLGGRFLAAFLLNATMLLAVQAGIAIAIYSPSTDPETIGPFGLAPFITAYTFISLPNAFFATAIQFSLASRSGRPTTSYFGSFFLFFMGFFVSALLLYYQQLGTLLDPIGIRYIIEDLAHVWTPTERRDRLIMLEGTVLYNRLFWLVIGVIAVVFTYLQFRFSDRRMKKKRSKAIEQTAAIDGTNVPVTMPHATRTFNIATRTSQTLILAWKPFRHIWIGRAGLALLIGIPLLTFIVLINKIEPGGVPRIPTTPLIISELTAPLSNVFSPWSIIPFLIVIISGEIVWRERDARMGDLMDTMPTSEWSLLLSKIISVAFMITVLMILLIIGGIITQMRLGYHDHDLALYFKIIFGLQFPEYLLFAILIVAIHVLVNNKYIAHLVSIAISALIVMPQLFGIEHNLLIYNSGPQWSYTDMRGFGASLEPWMWFKLYWAAWAILLSVAATIFWARGKDTGFRTRLHLARTRLIRTTTAVAIIAGTLVMTIGGFIFYNTNILNTYLTKSEYNTILAEYEKRYKQYEQTAQPGLKATDLHVEIFPSRGAASIKGTYHLVNRSRVPIDSIHLAIIPGAKIGGVTFDHDFTQAVMDDMHGYRIYSLQDPLMPGDPLRLQFDLEIERRGFGNHGVHESIVDNGTFFTNRDWPPVIGYQSRRELKSASDRRENGLPQQSLIPSLHDKDALMIERERTLLDVVMVTDKDQVAVTTGALQNSWEENGRRYFHYKTDGPIGNDFVFFSARYEVNKFKWQDIDVTIYYHPGHKSMLERMTKSIRASLDHYTKHFGPYRHSHLTYVEVRGNEIGMHADESMIRFSEGTALWSPGSFDLPFSVVAHELAHQWWGHKLDAAFVEGAPIMSETLAQYSAMEVMNEAYGRDQLQRLLSFMREPFPYAPLHHGEPLLRGIDPYLAYRKGPFALHALSEHIGADRVEGALRSLLDKHPTGQLPLTTTLDLYGELKAATPDSLQYLLHDLFEINTLWQFRVERASAEQQRDSTWQVTLEVRSRKVVVNEAGVETELPMNDWVEIGVFAARNNPMYLKRHHVNSNTQTIIVTVPERPALAGIDPNHVLDWEEREDDENIRRVRSFFEK